MESNYTKYYEQLGANSTAAVAEAGRQGITSYSGQQLSPDVLTEHFRRTAHTHRRLAEQLAERRRRKSSLQS